MKKNWLFAVIISLGASLVAAPDVHAKAKVVKPSAPTIISISSTAPKKGKVNVTITISLPTNSGGSKITGSKVTASGKSCAIKKTRTRCTIKGVKRGKGLRVSATSKNKKGFGAKSSVVRYIAGAPAFSSTTNDSAEVTANDPPETPQTPDTPNPPEDPIPVACTISGTSGDDRLIGTSGNDIICGGGGNDTINALEGDDIIYSVTLPDDLNAVSTFPRLFELKQLVIRTTGSESDVVNGGDGDDAIYGGSGNDTIDGGSGSDTIDAGFGDDHVKGGTDGDALNGGSGNDTVEGGSGDDTIDMGQGDQEVADGGEGQDICSSIDENIEVPIGCETFDRFGIYDKVAIREPSKTGVDFSWSGFQVTSVQSVVLDDSSLILAMSVNRQPLLVKLSRFGNLDRSFGVDGWITNLKSLTGNNFSDLRDLSLIGDHIFLTATGDQSPTSYGAFVAKFDKNGRRDETFGTDGIQRISESLNLETSNYLGLYQAQAIGDRIVIAYNNLVAMEWQVGWASISSSTGVTITGDYKTTAASETTLPSSLLMLDDLTFISTIADGRSFVYPLGEMQATPIEVAAPQLPNLVDAAFSKSVAFQTSSGWARVLLAGSEDNSHRISGFVRLLDDSPTYVHLDQFDSNGVRLDPTENPDGVEFKIPDGDENRCDAAATNDATVSADGLHLADNQLTVPLIRCNGVHLLTVDSRDGSLTSDLERVSPGLGGGFRYISHFRNNLDEYVVYLNGEIVIEKLN